MAPIKIGSTPFADLFRRDDGTQFEVPRGLFAGSGAQPPPPIGAPSLGVGPLAPPDIPPPPTLPPAPLAPNATNFGAGLLGGAPPPTSLSPTAQANLITQQKTQGAEITAKAEGEATKDVAEGTRQANQTSLDDLATLQAQRAQQRTDSDAKAAAIAEEEKANAEKAGESVFGTGGARIAKAIATALLGVAGGIIGVKTNNPLLGVQMVNNIIGTFKEQKKEKLDAAKELTESKRKDLVARTAADQQSYEETTRSNIAKLAAAENIAKTLAAQHTDEKTRGSLLTSAAGFAEQGLKLTRDIADKDFDHKIAAKNAATAAGGLALSKEQFAEQKKDKALDRATAVQAAVSRAGGLAALGLPPTAKEDNIVPNAADGLAIAPPDQQRAQKFYDQKLGAEQYIEGNRKLLEVAFQQDPTLLDPRRAGKVGPIDFGNAINAFAKTDKGRLLVDAIVSDVVLGYAKANGQGAVGDDEFKRYAAKIVGYDNGQVSGRFTPELVQQNIREAEKKYTTAIKDYLPADRRGNYKYDARAQTWTRRDTPGTKEADDWLKLYKARDTTAERELENTSPASPNAPYSPNPPTSPFLNELGGMLYNSPGGIGRR